MVGVVPMNKHSLMQFSIAGKSGFNQLSLDAAMDRVLLAPRSSLLAPRCCTTRYCDAGSCEKDDVVVPDHGAVWPPCTRVLVAHCHLLLRIGDEAHVDWLGRGQQGEGCGVLSELQYVFLAVAGAVAGRVAAELLAKRRRQWWCVARAVVHDIVERDVWAGWDDMDDVGRCGMWITNPATAF